MPAIRNHRQPGRPMPSDLTVPVGRVRWPRLSAGGLVMLDLP
jgi:hypothetical protein